MLRDHRHWATGLLPVLLLACAGAGGAASGGTDAVAPETLRSTGSFIRACVEKADWAATFLRKHGHKPKVQLAPLEDNAGGADTNAMHSAIERAFIQSGVADVLPWGDALAGMAAYQSDAMALGGGESSVTADPDFLVGGRIERIADGGTATRLRLLDAGGQPVCDGPAAAP